MYGCLCVSECVCVCVCVWVGGCVYRMVSRDKILRFKNTFIIISAMLSITAYYSLIAAYRKLYMYAQTCNMHLFFIFYI